MGATCEAGTAYPSGATEFILGVRAALFLKRNLVPTNKSTLDGYA
jgi:hypothetical protein